MRDKSSSSFVLLSSGGTPQPPSTPHKKRKKEKKKKRKKKEAKAWPRKVCVGCHGVDGCGEKWSTANAMVERKRIKVVHYSRLGVGRGVRRVMEPSCWAGSVATSLATSVACGCQEARVVLRQGRPVTWVGCVSAKAQHAVVKRGWGERQGRSVTSCAGWGKALPKCLR